MRSTHCLSYGIASASLVGGKPNFFYIILFLWQIRQFFTCTLTWSLIFGHQKYWVIVASVLSVLEWRSTVWYHFITLFYSVFETRFLSFKVHDVLYYLPLWKNLCLNKWFSKTNSLFISLLVLCSLAKSLKSSGLLSESCFLTKNLAYYSIDSCSVWWSSDLGSLLRSYAVSLSSPLT